MATLPADDLKDIDKPLTYREMFQKIMVMIQADRKDRADDRNMLETFIGKQDKINDELMVRVKSIETCNGVQDEAIDTLKKRVDGWNTLNSIGVIIASILAALGLTGS